MFPVLIAGRGPGQTPGQRPGQRPGRDGGSYHAFIWQPRNKPVKDPGYSEIGTGSRFVGNIPQQIKRMVAKVLVKGAVRRARTAHSAGNTASTHGSSDFRASPCTCLERGPAAGAVTSCTVHCSKMHRKPCKSKQKVRTGTNRFVLVQPFPTAAAGKLPPDAP